MRGSSLLWFGLALAIGSRASAKVPGAFPDRQTEEFCSPVEDDCSPDTLEIAFDRPDAFFQFGETVGVRVVLDTVSDSVRGWSYGVAHDPERVTLLADSVTIEGTDAERALAAPFFNVTQAVDDGVATGFVSSVLLSFTSPATLVSPRTNSLARARYVLSGDFFFGQTTLRLVDGVLPGAPASPTRIQLSCGDGCEPSRPGTLIHGVLDAEPPRQIELFTRGDADLNGRLDLLDALAIVWFAAGVRGPSFVCFDAMDSDDNGRVDFLDAVPIINRVFRRGDALPAPTSCGEDPTPDGLGCFDFFFAC